MPFEQFGLSDPLVKGILATGYTAPTEIQTHAIPSAVQGKDVIGCAQTGTGKTAAFVLPMLNRLSHEKKPKNKYPRALILTPTRELAVQIETAIKTYGRYLDIKTLVVYGGVDLRKQSQKLKRGVDIIVATPGRLMDHMQRGNINFKIIEVLVLDEADRMFDMGFIKDVRKIVGVLPKKRQTMLFSATMSKEVKALTKGIQKSPVTVQIGHERNPAETVTQHIFPVDQVQKHELLIHLLQNMNMYCVLVFSRTKHGADKICKRLDKAGVSSIAIHSNRTQNQRQRAMEGFKAGKYQVMVATDIAARGIDVRGITHVINYDVPAYAEDYIHRIGRTGRAENSGDAITFVSREEEKYIFRIEKYISKKFKPEKCEGFAYNASPVPTLKQNKKNEQKKRKDNSRKKTTRPGEDSQKTEKKNRRKFATTQGKTSANKKTANKKYTSKKTNKRHRTA